MSKFIIFTAGALAGSLVTWQILKTKYEQREQEAVDSVKEVFSKREKTEDETAAREMSDKNINKPDITEYASTIKKAGYVDYSSTVNKEDKKKSEEGEKYNPIYVIIPEEFGMINGYDEISLTYYSDQVLVDEDGDVVENVDEIIGYDSLNHFGEYEDDSVYVRNEIRKADYEILFDPGKYSNIDKP